MLEGKPAAGSKSPFVKLFRAGQVGQPTHQREQTSEDAVSFDSKLRYHDFICNGVPDELEVGNADEYGGRVSKAA